MEENLFSRLQILKLLNIMNKKIIEQMIKDTEERIEQSKQSLVMTEIMERFARRRVLAKPMQGEQMLIETTKKIKMLKALIDSGIDEELLNFLKEIKDEKE